MVRPEFPVFEIDSAFQGQEGLNLIKKASGKVVLMPWPLSMSECRPVRMESRQYPRFGKSIPIYRSSSAQPFLTILGRKWCQNSDI
jgi:hypothetical protein